MNYLRNESACTWIALEELKLATRPCDIRERLGLPQVFYEIETLLRTGKIHVKPTE